MSICFAAAINTPVQSHELRCMCGAHSGPFKNRTDAVAAMVEGQFGRGVAMPECAKNGDPDWCEHQIPYVHANVGEEGPYLSVANGNAGSILSLMGLRTDTPGTMSGAELMRHVDAARLAGFPENAAIGDYFDRVFTQLADVAQWSQERDLDVSWA